ncbi:hypothetical protein JMN32_08645 [Fulvivirga sp. 29W222]|uniref:Uncharacterized protein n=1 Tax=Fulvivirga marina TaxID=2494733 RepID=A0A937KDM0_9BACT|nr:hypothetical protein [Fulvivirga marina]MBL6446373.1 hypothetical protein [Fulvivirga marina]
MLEPIRIKTFEARRLEKGNNKYQLWDFLITALAISIGASFWFDLSDELIQLREAVSQQAAKREVIKNAKV